VFLSATLKRNPELVAAAAELHRAGELLPDTYILDLDAVEANARLLAKAADELGIELYLVCKQFGRNPLLIEAIARHIPLATAIDFREAQAVVAAGAGIGNLGHVVQIPESGIPEALSWAPRVMTVYSWEKARSISEAAGALGRVQPILLRVIGDEDFFYPAQEGGIHLSQLASVTQRISEELTFVRIEGVTSFPCILFDSESKKFYPTPNLETLLGAKRILEGCGIAVSQVNVPSATCAATLPLLREVGATHAEPGHALTGTTPLHAHDLDQPELPAMVYMSEVSHLLPDGRPVVFGGGFYPRGRVRSALVLSSGHQEHVVRLDVEPASADNIDYYRTLASPEVDGAVRVGDTVVFSFRTQIFVTRSQVAVLSGLRTGTPKLAGIFTSLGQEL
jgi:predicted amino acid racemase